MGMYNYVANGGPFVNMPFIFIPIIGIITQTWWFESWVLGKSARSVYKQLFSKYTLGSGISIRWDELSIGFLL